MALALSACADENVKQAPDYSMLEGHFGEAGQAAQQKYEKQLRKKRLFQRLIPGMITVNYSPITFKSNAAPDNQVISQNHQYPGQRGKTCCSLYERKKT